MKQLLTIVWWILSYVLISSTLILAVKAYFLQSGTVRVDLTYRSFQSEDLTLFWNSGKGFSGQDQLSRRTDSNATHYTYTLSRLDSLVEIRIDPDGYFDKAELHEVTITGLKKPCHINTFSDCSVNGLIIKSDKGVCHLQRDKTNIDPYMVIKIPPETRQIDKDFTFRDLLLFSICLIISLGLLWLMKTSVSAFFAKADPAHLFLVLIFFIFIFSYWSNTILKYYKTPPSIENRALSVKPGLQGLENDPKKYFNEYTSWFGDHFPFKQIFVHANSWLKINLFHISPMPESMYIGKDFEFFTANQLLKDDITGKRRLSKEELAILLANTTFKQKYLSDQHISYYLTIPPSKQTSYEDLLPLSLSLQLKGTKMVGQFKSEINKQLTSPYIDVIDLLKERHTLYPKERVFYQYDIHWSDWGAFLAYQKLINTIFKDHEWVGKALSLNEITLDTIYDESADLAKLILMQNTFKKERYTIQAKEQDSIQETVVFGLYPFPIYKYKNPKAKGKLLVFRDSYSEQWKWLIARHFNESVFIWDQKITQKLIDEYKPDIVIQENCEMFLFFLFEPLKSQE